MSMCITYIDVCTIYGNAYKLYAPDKLLKEKAMDENR